MPSSQPLDNHTISCLVQTTHANLFSPRSYLPGRQAGKQLLLTQVAIHPQLVDQPATLLFQHSITQICQIFFQRPPSPSSISLPICGHGAARAGARLLLEPAAALGLLFVTSLISSLAPIPRLLLPPSVDCKWYVGLFLSHLRALGQQSQQLVGHEERCRWVVVDINFVAAALRETLVFKRASSWSIDIDRGATKFFWDPFSRSL